MLGNLVLVSNGQNLNSKGQLFRSIQLLSPSDQKKLLFVSVIQISLNLLDLLGVLAIGILGAISVTNLQSSPSGDQVTFALRMLQIENLAFQNQAIILGLGAVGLLVGRTIVSIIFTRRILFFLSRRGAEISAKLVSQLLSQPLLVVQARTTQETLYAVTNGVSLIVLQVLATLTVMISDISLLLIMGIGFFIIDPVTAFGISTLFFLIVLFLYRFMYVRAGNLGQFSSEQNIRSNEKIVEVFSSYRESVVRNRRDYYAREIKALRFKLADTAAEMNFMPYVSKYVIESSVIVAALLLGAVQFILQDAAHAAGTLGIFLAAGTRIAPAVLRVQQGSITIRSALGQSSPTLDLIDSLGDAPLIENVDDEVDIVHDGFEPEVIISNVSVTYPGKHEPALSSISLTIPSGASVAIVGPSGAGKTTLIDVILGVLNFDEGLVTISGFPPLNSVMKWPGAISYVPQDVVIANGTVRQNVALGYPEEYATDELVNQALATAQLGKFIEDTPQGLDADVGERGARISGGQRQRLGIARAMFTRPMLLVLDEATSSLDGETEASISHAINSLRGSTTIIMIAHRLSTVRNADLVVYMHAGKVLATGTFEEVRAIVPDFDLQAKLMGL
jgi:ABC-type multidrug transport system fused ATPase/permease subunit